MARWDIHTHCSEISDCSHIAACDIIREAKAIGLDGVCITDHIYFANKDGCSRDYSKAAELARELGIGFIPAFEATGVGKSDLLIYLPTGIGLDEKTCWTMFNKEAALIAWVHEVGGAAVHAHPYGMEYSPVVAELDGVEILNWNAMRDKPLFKLREGVNIALTGSSDAHSAGVVGRCFTEFEDEIRTPEDLIRGLRSKRCKPGTWGK